MADANAFWARTDVTLRERVAHRETQHSCRIMTAEVFFSGAKARLSVLCTYNLLDHLVGRRHWEGWVLAAVNSVILCFIGMRTSQWGFIPANLFCIVLYAANLRAWRKAEIP
jgi:uncharacterized membrane protein